MGVVWATLMAGLLVIAVTGALDIDQMERDLQELLDHFGGCLDDLDRRWPVVNTTTTTTATVKVHVDVHQGGGIQNAPSGNRRRSFRKRTSVKKRKKKRWTRKMIRLRQKKWKKNQRRRHRTPGLGGNYTEGEPDIPTTSPACWITHREPAAIEPHQDCELSDFTEFETASDPTDDCSSGHLCDNSRCADHCFHHGYAFARVSRRRRQSDLDPLMTCSCHTSVCSTRAVMTTTCDTFQRNCTDVTPEVCLNDGTWSEINVTQDDVSRWSASSGCRVREIRRILLDNHDSCLGADCDNSACLRHCRDAAYYVATRFKTWRSRAEPYQCTCVCAVTQLTSVATITILEYVPSDTCPSPTPG